MIHGPEGASDQNGTGRLAKNPVRKNMETLRRIALDLLKQDKSKRKNAGWDEHYLLKVLHG
jgi:hypothetical protein